MQILPILIFAALFFFWTERSFKQPPPGKPGAKAGEALGKYLDKLLEK
ncbi:MAG: hypothetical protein F6K19_03010 [Cyanothece sp. SIO1E1]|nr:hypothetical protein [Cyanothece sp. SIO1E1]